MFALQEQRECVTLQVIDAGSQCRQPDGPNSEDSASGIEGFASAAPPAEAFDTALPKDGTSQTCNVQTPQDGSQRGGLGQQQYSGRLRSGPREPPPPPAA